MNEIKESPVTDLRKKIRHILYGRSTTTTLIHDVLLAANIFIIIFSLFSIAYDFGTVGHFIEFGFGIIFLVEYILRFWISRHKGEFVFRLVNGLDIVVIFSLFSTVFVSNFAFLRVLRTLQILRAYKMYQGRFSRQNEFIMRHTEVITAALNLVVFLLIMAAIVYSQQVGINTSIQSYADALYFTVATLTTTGFGDIIPVGNVGRMLTVIIMILGVTLFFRLVKSMFVPRQLYVTCQGCGLGKHPLYAYFCNHCGHKIHNKYLQVHDHKKNII